jgi:hypothetical protein
MVEAVGARSFIACFYKHHKVCYIFVAFSSKAQSGITPCPGKFVVDRVCSAAGEYYDGLQPWPRVAMYASGRWGRSFGAAGIDPILVPLWASELWYCLRNWWRGVYWGSMRLTSLTADQQEGLHAYRMALKIRTPPWAYLPYNAWETPRRVRDAGGIFPVQAIEDFAHRFGHEYLDNLEAIHEEVIHRSVELSNSEKRGTVDSEQLGMHEPGSLRTRADNINEGKAVSLNTTLIHSMEHHSMSAEKPDDADHLTEEGNMASERAPYIDVNAVHTGESHDATAATYSVKKPRPMHTQPRWMSQASNAGVRRFLSDREGLLLHLSATPVCSRDLLTLPYAAPLPSLIICRKRGNTHSTCSRLQPFGNTVYVPIFQQYHPRMLLASC